MLVVKNLTKKYVIYEGFYPEYAPNQYFSWIVNIMALTKRKKKFIEALCNVSFKCRRGEILGIVGPNGSGKSTLLRCIAGILRPDSGEIFLEEFDLINDFDKIKGKIVYISALQWRSYEWELSCYDNLMFLAKLMGFKGNEAQEKVLNALKNFELIKYKDYPPRKLSTGLRQRLALARLTLSDPLLLLLDEPTLGLDMVSANSFRKYIKNLAKAENKIIVLASHNLKEIELLCDKVLFLKKGKPIYYGELKDIKKLFKNITVLEVDLKVDNYSKLIELKDKLEIYYDFNHLNTGICNLKILLKNKHQVNNVLEYLNKIGEVFYQVVRGPSLEEVYYHVYREI